MPLADKLLCRVNSNEHNTAKMAQKKPEESLKTFVSVSTMTAIVERLFYGYSRKTPSRGIRSIVRGVRRSLRFAEKVTN